VRSNTLKAKDSFVVARASQAMRAAGEVGDGQRIAIAAVCEHELALVVGAPQIVWPCGLGKRRTLRTVAPAFAVLDQTVAIEDGMDRADRRRVDVGIKPLQPIPDLGRAPTGLVVLEAHDQRLDLKGQLIGLAIRSSRPVGQRLEATFLVAPENLVACLAGNAELPAQTRHLLPVQRPGNELQPFIHRVTRFPGHLALLAKAQIV
jgi:hypothetical protein